MSFRRFGLARRQPYCTLNTKNTIKIFCFQVEDFLQCRFLTTQGKNGVNPYGLTSILTMSGRKFAYKKHGSDNSFHPKLRFQKKVKTTETQWYLEIKSVARRNVIATLVAYVIHNKWNVINTKETQKIQALRDYIRLWQLHTR